MNCISVWNRLFLFFILKSYSKEIVHGDENICAPLSILTWEGIQNYIQGDQLNMACFPRFMKNKAMFK